MICHYIVTILFYKNIKCLLFFKFAHSILLECSLTTPLRNVHPTTPALSPSHLIHVVQFTYFIAALDAILRLHDMKTPDINPENNTYYHHGDYVNNSKSRVGPTDNTTIISPGDKSNLFV